MPTVLCIMAHPDDVDFLAGGCCVLWARAGWQIELLVITAGNRGADRPDVDPLQLAELRQREQRAAARRLGISETTFLGHDDGDLRPSPELRRELVASIRRTRPDRVVAQDPTLRFWGRHYVNHPDHIAAGQAVLEAVYPAAKKPLIHPELLERGLEPHVVRELWLAGSPEPDTFVDISEVLEDKVAAVLEHRSQFEGDSVADFIRSWARDAARHLPCEAAESFRTLELSPRSTDHRFESDPNATGRGGEDA